MVKRAHHRSAVRNVLAGTIGTLGALAVSTQVASANHVIVKVGDTIWNIAQQHQISVSALENANVNTIKKVSDSVDLIYAGQQLTLPGDDSTTMQADQNGRYTVKPGDTLSEIARHFHVSVATLMVWNGLTSDQLYIGQQLVVDGQSVSVDAVQPNVAPVTSVAPEANQESAVVASSAAPVQSPSADQQAASAVDNVANTVSMAPTTSAANTTVVTSTADEVTSAASAATAGSMVAVSTSTVNTPSSASASDQMALAAATNNTVASSAMASATSQVSGSATNTAPVSTTGSTVTASTTPAPTTPSAMSTSATMSASVTPQPVASQSPVSTAQSVAPQSASQAPTQPRQAATATSAQPQANGSQDLNTGSVVSLAVKIANSNSVPYVWGGSSLSGTDCSGLVDYVYAHAEGKQLPHNTVALESCVNQHPVSQAQAGDILFWGQHGATYHCAIYTGNNQFAAAAKPGTNVASYTISPYFQPSFAGTVK